MSTGFSTIMQPIDLGIAWKGQVDLNLLLAEDSILTGVFSLIPSLFFFVFSCRHGYIESWLFLVFGFLHYDQGKWGSTVSYKNAFGSHCDHTRNLISLLHWINRFELSTRQNEIPREFCIFLYFIFNSQIYK